MYWIKPKLKLGQFYAIELTLLSRCICMYWNGPLLKKGYFYAIEMTSFWGTATDKKLTVILGQNRGFVRFLVLVSVYAIDWTWFEKEGQVSKGHKKCTITLLTFSIFKSADRLAHTHIHTSLLHTSNKMDYLASIRRMTPPPREEDGPALFYSRRARARSPLLAPLLNPLNIGAGLAMGLLSPASSSSAWGWSAAATSSAAFFKTS
jgi:hypothetical protein